MTLTDIIGYMPHGLVAMKKGYSYLYNVWMPDDLDAVRYDDVVRFDRIDGDCYRPVLRPMTDLATEITEKGYYGGKPFVPIRELANVWAGFSIDDYRLWLKDNFIGIETFHPNVIFLWWMVERRFEAWQPIMFGSANKKRSIELWKSYWAFDLLHRWHFDYRGLIDAGEAVDVNELKRNPYE